MVSRLTPYGYKVENGQLVIISEQAAVIKRIYQEYLSGDSCKKIANALNADNIQYNGRMPVWDKDKVNHLLKKSCYTGERDFPIIIDAETFQAAQQLLRSKTKCIARHERNVTNSIPGLHCQHCGAPLRKAKNKQNPPSSIMYPSCNKCGVQLTMNDEELIAEIERQVKEHYESAKAPEYRQSDTSVRLANAINRGLEKPDNPDKVIDLILQGVSARYNCWPSTPDLNPDNYRSEERVWKNIRRAVADVTVARSGKIIVHFK